MPSPSQKVPNAVSKTPTVNLSVFSGIDATGRCRRRPSPMTSSSAAPAPAAAGASKSPLAPMAMTSFGLMPPDLGYAVLDRAGLGA